MSPLVRSVSYDSFTFIYLARKCLLKSASFKHAFWTLHNRQANKPSESLVGNTAPNTVLNSTSCDTYSEKSIESRAQKFGIRCMPNTFFNTWLKIFQQWVVLTGCVTAPMNGKLVKEERHHVTQWPSPAIHPPLTRTPISPQAMQLFIDWNGIF